MCCPIYNGQMFGEEKNIKDIHQDSADNFGLTIKDTLPSISYTKINKLITALYMVTDIIDKEEPLRNKLRTSGVNIISDINSTPSSAGARIREIMSFLDIASAVNIISEMNCNILRKEFAELNQSILSAQGGKDSVENLDTAVNLTEFFKEPARAAGGLPLPKDYRGKDKFQSLGQRSFTRIGVQKGSTLMKALSDRNLVSSMSHRNPTLKKQRQNEIIKVIQKNGGSATITDIKNGAYGSLVSCGEKTLQRELVSMVKDNVLNKTGEKRWSRYFILGASF